MPDPKLANPGNTRPRALSLGAIAIALWVMLVAVLGYAWLRPSHPQTANASTLAVPAARSDKADQALALMVSARLDDLGIKPKPESVLLPQDLSLEEALAIKRGDFGQADRIAEDVLAHSHLQSWSFYPFAPFMENIVRYEDPALLQRLNDWIAGEPRSAIAYLIRGSYYDEVAWITRGNDFATEVPYQQMRAFRDDISKAGTDIQTAIDLDPKIPWSYFELLHVAASGTNPAAAEQVFETAIKAFPGYYPLYRDRLGELGSPSAMSDFVDQYARGAPSSSPIKLLYLQLYVNLLQTAGSACASGDEDVKQHCIADLLDRIKRSDLRAGMLQAIQLYNSSDHTQFSMAIWPLLDSMACGRCYGSPAAVSGVLQAVANVMGSDTQLMDNPGHNSYVLDDITARVWGQMGNTSNAARKFREALKDAEQTPFPDEAQKAVALATIFDDMTQFAEDSSQFIDMIVYQEAENEVGGSNFNDTPYRSCYAYYRMKYFAEAVKECSALINGNGNYLMAHYWRGEAYGGLRQWDAAIADLSPAADIGDNWIRVGAAIDISVDFGAKGDFAGQLASMNQYPYLFDPTLQPPSDLAVAYNNRCYAYMQLGQLQKALDDCTTSLKYDRIPDALHKEQELLKRLGLHAAPSSSEPAPKPSKAGSTQPT